LQFCRADFCSGKAKLAENTAVLSRALTQHGLKAAVKTDACSTLVSLNIFAGTEHDSANYGKVQESFRKHTAETANKGRASPKGKPRDILLSRLKQFSPRV
jgi:D-serine deaminase-like pyridoxal phosphate-dependent protein